jgi:GT2 family glycosyltransferase
VELSIVIVAFDEGDDLRPVLDELERQTAAGDEVVVVHNEGGEPAASRRTAEIAREHGAVDRVIETGANLGFPRGANVGAAATDRETLLFLNPDARPDPGCLDALRDPPPGWDAWQGLVVLPDGRVNTAGGVTHFTGFGWTGRYLEPADAIGTETRPAGFLSGACLAIRREAWDAVGGFPDSFFLYVDDVDISHRLRLQGRDFGLLPAARVTHDYEFGRRPDKLRELERNRLLMVVRCYPAPVLAAVAPALIATELALLAVAAVDGWAGAKVRGTGGFLRGLPRALRERRAIQAGARIPAREFAAALAPELDSPYFGAVGRSAVVRLLLRAYWSLVRAALRSGAAPSAAAAPRKP